MPNFLSTYRLATMGDEAPENYHIMAGVSALSAIVSRRIWIQVGRFRYYPNLYTILLGPPGNGKTTAMSFAKKFIYDLKNVPFSAECQTKESLCKEWSTYERTMEIDGVVHEYTPYSIFVTELSHFLGPNSGHMIDFLTTIYDQDFYDVKTKNKGTEKIKGPYITLLACTTPEWITTYLRSDIISGGFTRRAIFVNEYESPLRIPFAEVTPEQVAAKEQLFSLARSVELLRGEIQWTEDARKFYANWYTGLVLPSDLSIRWYYKTKHMQMFKLASLFVASELPETLVLKTEHLEMTLALLDRIETNLQKVFQGMGRNELSTISQKVLDVLSAAGGILPENKLRGIMYRDANGQELQQIMQHLATSEKIKRWDLNSTGPTGQTVTQTFIALAGLDPQAKLRGGGAAAVASQPLPAALRMALNAGAGPTS